jgi:hypothetical protein
MAGEVAPAATKEKEEKWGDSEARKYLYNLLVDKKIPGRDDIKPKAVFEQYCQHRPEFKDYQDYKKLDFASKLLYLRNKAELRGNRAARDDTCLKHDREIFPAPTCDTKGNPNWAGSKAQEQLRKDIHKMASTWKLKMASR